MAELQRREIAAMAAALKRAQRTVDKLTNRGENVVVAKTAAKRLARSMTGFLKLMSVGAERISSSTPWQTVMLVTCVETYLQDVLADAAHVDPSLMENSEQRALYADVVAANSIEELAQDMRARWARAVLRDGGPKRWLARLEKMGVPTGSYPASLVAQLERIWGIRHAIVHSAGRAGADFVKRHPGVVSKPGDRITIGVPTLHQFVTAVAHFMEPTEEFFLNRYPMLATSAATKP
jgi:hypothetical protein